MATQRKLGRRTDHRSAMLRNSVASLFKHEKITTTLSRAKETQKLAEKVITMGKQGDLASKRQISALLYEPKVAQKVVEEIAPRYQDRKGGYSRIIKLGKRRGDGSEMVILELV